MNIACILRYIILYYRLPKKSRTGKPVTLISRKKRKRTARHRKAILPPPCRYFRRNDYARLFLRKRDEGTYDIYQYRSFPEIQ